MPTEGVVPAAAAARHPVAARRILRLALGTALCLLFSQVFVWPLSFIAPVLTLFVLALPLPAPNLRQGVTFMAALLAPLCAGLLLVPFLHHARWTGIGLLTLGLFYSFYYTARGGSPIVGTFMTVGLTLVVTIGSVNLDVLILLIQGLAVGALTGIAFVWIAHLLLPELPPDPALAGLQKPQPTRPDPVEARREALRSMLIVLPIALVFLFMSASPSYTVVMIKVASMGQQASSDKTREMGRSLLASTLWGGVGAIIGWYLMGIWPSLILFVLLTVLAGLIYGRWIFQGPMVHPRFQMASYAFLTMLVLLAPAVTSASGDVSSAFYSRLFLFILIAVYGTAAVAVFDAFWPGRRNPGLKQRMTPDATRNDLPTARGGPTPGNTPAD